MVSKRKPSGTDGNTSPTETATEGGEPPKQRWVVSHLLSHYRDHDQRIAARNLFSARFDQHLAGSVNILADNGAEPSGERRVILCEGDATEMAAIGNKLSPDTIIEPELPRRSARCIHPAVTAAQASAEAAGPTASAPGTGATLTLTLQSAEGTPVAGATVVLTLQPQTAGSTVSTSVGGVSAVDGSVSLPYDPTLWRPGLAAIEPAGGFWAWVVAAPTDGAVVELTALPTNGPLGWWQLLVGATAERTATAGAGIKVGVIDTGIGPHPYLSHATGVGAFLDGGFTAGSEAALDCLSHGTHVAGIIGARPPEGSDAFTGIAPAAALSAARVFTATSGANQGDIASAIDHLSSVEQVDLINLSLVGSPSAIEHDAVIAALRSGTLCIAAAGNQGTPINGGPACYPEVVAISAIGLIGTAPAGSTAAANLPSSLDRFGYGGTFLAAFSNYGPNLSCTAPGNGIISTVPERDGLQAPYADMSGTSAAAPVTTGALAALLSQDEAFKALPRDTNRAAYARSLLSTSCAQLLLSPIYQGAGLAREIRS